MNRVIAQRLASSAGALVPERAHTLVPFAMGARGGFPYRWEDSVTKRFNAATYAWISANVKAGSNPIELSENFPTAYIEALSCISYRLSANDQYALTRVQTRLQSRQAAILDAWQAAFGSIPAPNTQQMPIDVVLDTIVNEWAQPPTDLTSLAAVQNVSVLLNAVPGRGEPVIPALTRYLGELGKDVPLINATTMNTGRLHAALHATQWPNTENGGLTTDDGIVHPAYVVATPVAEILRGLNDPAKIIHLVMMLRRSSPTQYAAAIDDGDEITMPAEELLTITPPRSAECLLARHVTPDAQDVRVEVTFRGIADVVYGPSQFDPASRRNWFWPAPIADAVTGGKDRSGFKFSPDPQIDFSTSGPFGFLTEVVISGLPSFRIVVGGASLHESCAGIDAPWRLSFAGVPLSGYAAASAFDSDAQATSVAFEPPVDDGTDSRAWVHLAAPSYPVAR